MVRSILVLVFSFIFSMVSGQGSYATIQQEIKGNLNSVLDLTLIPQNNLNISFVNTNEFENGKTILAATVLKIIATRKWVISAKTLSPTFTPLSLNASNNMPSSVLSIKESKSSNFIPLSSQSPASQIASGTIGDALATGHELKIDYLFKPGLTFAPGVYSIDLLFTITAF